MTHVASAASWGHCGGMTRNNGISQASYHENSAYMHSPRNADVSRARPT